MIQKATFAMGCFWGPDDFFSQLPGVLGTVVGYAGGTKKNPTYTNLDDHTETIEIDFDPSAISYKELLKHFWEEHDPTALQKRQYKSIIFYHNERQRGEAQASRRGEEQKYRRKIATEIQPAGIFYKAEEYHQKYFQKQRQQKGDGVR